MSQPKRYVPNQVPDPTFIRAVQHRYEFVWKYTDVLAIELGKRAYHALRAM